MKEFKQKIEYIFLNCFVFIVLVLYCIIPRPLTNKLLYSKVECEKCGRKMMRRRNWKKVYPQEIKDLPIKCDDCCSPTEIKERERIAEKYTHLL